MFSCSPLALPSTVIALPGISTPPKALLGLGRSLVSASARVAAPLLPASVPLWVPSRPERSGPVLAPAASACSKAIRRKSTRLPAATWPYVRKRVGAWICAKQQKLLCWAQTVYAVST